MVAVVWLVLYCSGVVVSGCGDDGGGGVGSGGVDVVRFTAVEVAVTATSSAF